MSNVAGKDQTHYYAYDPSFEAALIFTLLFVASSGYHMWQIWCMRSWYFIPFLIGCLLEVGGYVGRAISATEETNQWTLLPFILQNLLLLLGPPFYAVSIYMVLGRLIALLEAGHYSIIRLRWLTKFFLVGDVLSILAQGAGGGMLSSADTKSALDLAKMIVLIGLGIQIAFFSLFIVATMVFHYRIHHQPTTKSCKILSPWKTLLLVLYGTSILIMLRSIFRVAEYAGGKEGELMIKEIYIYIFDAVPMIMVSVAFNVFHPANIIRSGPGASFQLQEEESEMSLFEAARSRC
ncbi:RTA1 like protein-domain-containing protein [Plectosphaerella cucumerina]|uniref:RTA1 like protein-domain-containing protein n=1 Tax=Plectosphaerella cucumerina TaxID=40658 RepID=A0A8K0TAH6_9PEZI|nr:RTA1 like protein-domain-containing protein [Plectosphaerella cucumerina]